MSTPRPIPEGFAEEAGTNCDILCAKYHCGFPTIQRWREELGYQIPARYRRARGRYGGPSPVYFDKEIADICLNCTAETCRGDCERVRSPGVMTHG